METINSLQPNSVLQNGKYVIEKILGQGGFGITYLAEYPLMSKKVAIKELFIAGYCVRNTQNAGVTLQSMPIEDYNKFKQRFIEEAKILHNLRNPYLVWVQDVFEENNTVYFVMDFVSGNTLRSVLKQKSKLSENESINFILQIAEALKTVHSKNLLHRDIKPENIIITPENKAILIDFGNARTFTEGKSIVQSAFITPGYAPPEQYFQKEHRGFYIDIYALGATLYSCVTGIVPIAAIERQFDDKNLDGLETISTKIRNIILKAMQIKPTDRYQTVDQFMEALLNDYDNSQEQEKQERISLQQERFKTEKEKQERARVEQEKQERARVEQEKSNAEAKTVKVEGNNFTKIKKTNRVTAIIVILIIVASLIYVFKDKETKDETKKIEDEVPVKITTEIKDADENIYTTVTIGTQTWLNENLKTTKYNDGTAIPKVTNKTEWIELNIAAYCWYENDYNTYGKIYGALYNWYVVDKESNGNKNICPVGYHVPTDTEWTTLTNYLGGEDIAGGKMKEKGTINWKSPNTDATNSSNFAALPSGNSSIDHDAFPNIGYAAYFWSSTDNNSNAWYRRLNYNSGNLYRYDNDKRYGFSIRCIKN